MSLSSRNLSDTAKQTFADNAQRHANNQRMRALLGVFIALLATYGICIYFVGKVILDVLTRP